MARRAIAVFRTGTSGGFFLALLLNVGDRAQILRFVEQQYPGTDPIERITGWIEELLAASAGPGGTSGSDRTEYDLGEAAIVVLRHLLRQRSPNQIVAALHEEYDDVERQRPGIRDLCASLTSSALLRPLFRVQP